jgi:hypothetical protein
MTHTMPTLLGHAVGVRRVVEETPDAKSIVVDIPPPMLEYSPSVFSRTT